MSLMNNRKSLIVAMVTGAAVFVIFGSIVLNSTPKNNAQQNVPQYQYAVAVANIKKGDVIKEENLEIKSSAFQIDGTYKATGELIGRKAASDIEAGKPIIKNFIEKIEVEEEKPMKEPEKGYRAIPILVRQSAIPPYVMKMPEDAVFDLFTRENSLKIENLKIIDILSPPRDDSNKMLILQIKESDIGKFIEFSVHTKGFVFVQKNPKEYGPYRFIDLVEETALANVKMAKKLKNIAKDLDDVGIARISPDGIPNIDDIGEGSFGSRGKAVEVIVGSTKEKLEFRE